MVLPRNINGKKLVIFHGTLLMLLVTPSIAWNYPSFEVVEEKRAISSTHPRANIRINHAP